MANTRVKVPRTVLIERIQESIDRATKEHDAALEKFDKAVAEYISKLPGEMDKRAKEIAALTGDDVKEFVEKVRSNSYDHNTLVSIKLRVPRLRDEDYTYYGRDRYTRHDFDGYIKALEKSKRVLEASTEELISVAATDEYANYL